MSNTSTISAPTSSHFADNFWESLEKNGIIILLDRMRGAKQTCEKYKHAYEARALLEEEYGKTLLQIAQKQKSSNTENGSSKLAMDSMQAEFVSVAESHLHLSNLLRENIILPLSNLLIKQRTLRKNLQTSIQKFYSNKQLQVQFVRRAHKRHNMEIEKANLLVQQQLTEKDKQATFRMAEMTIDKLKKVYDEGVKDLERVVEEWNIEWKNTCNSFERLEVERLEFFKSNISNCVNLMIGCLENEVQACERVSSEASKIDVAHDLAAFVNKNKSSNIIPTPMEYIKLHAYQEANQNRGDFKLSHNSLRDTIDGEGHSESEDRVHIHIRKNKTFSVAGSVSKANASRLKATSEEIASEPAQGPKAVEHHVVETEANDNSEPVMMVGVMEVYPSGDEDDDESEFEYITESESEEDHDDDQQAETLKVSEVENKTDQEEKHEEKGADETKNEDIVERDDSAAMKGKSVQLAAAPEVQKEQETQSEELTQLREQISSRQKDKKVSRLMSAYHQEVKKEKPTSLLAKNGFNTKRRVSFLEDNNAPSVIQPDYQQTDPIKDTNAIPTKTLDRFFKRDQPEARPIVTKVPQNEDMNDDYGTSSDAAALELDDMLRELDSKRIIRTDEDHYSQPDIRPTSSISSPNLTQQRQQQRRSIPSQYFQSQQQNQKYQSSRRMSTVESTRSLFGQPQFDASTKSMDLYDPFNSLSSKETEGTINSSKDSSMEDKEMKSDNTPPSVQMMHEQMLSNNRHQSPMSSSASSSGESTHSFDNPGKYRNDKFIQDFYSVGSKTPSPNNTVSTKSSTSDSHFIDFAIALYDYDAAEEGEIGFKEGDLFGIISKSEEDEQGWWEASLLNPRNRKVVRTGVVPSNFLKTASQ